MTRVILLTGKSGAGVSTIAAATALRCAEQGHRTALFSLQPRAEEGVVTEGGWPGLLSPRLTVENTGDGTPDSLDWSPLDAWLQRLVQERASAAVPIRLTDLPGIDRLSALMVLGAHLDSESYDCVVVDCPPAPEMVGLLRLVEGASLWERQPPVPDHSLARLARPLVTRLANIPDADAALAVLTEARRRLARLREELTDGSRSSFRLVSADRAADTGVVRQTYRALRLLEYPVDALIVNRGAAARAAARSAASVLEDDPGAPVTLEAGCMDAEPVDVEALTRLADGLYGKLAAAAILALSPRTTLAAEGGMLSLRIPLPITAQDTVSVTQAGDYVTVTAMKVQRVLALPPALRGRACTGARLSGGVLSLLFN